ncbi:MAG: DUF4199 domain-containing protein [Bacteroidales bacterium]|nr:DUF4199 domain-containing protein [Bacteroidales bacterium]
MENTRQSVFKQALSFGLGTGLALIALSLLFFVFDLTGNKTFGFLGYIVLLGGIVFSAINYRDKHLGGIISYGQSFSVGFYTGAVAAILSGIFTYFFFRDIAPDMIDTMIRDAEDNMLRSKPDITDEELELAMLYTKKFITPGWLGIIGFFSYAFFSLIFALIAGIFIKKESSF